MINNTILINYTSWAYDITNRYMAALRGHKYHILPTSSSPLVISIALLLFLLTLVFNLHGSKMLFSPFDTFVQYLLNEFHGEIFGKKIQKGFFSIILTNQTYSNIHLFWIAPFFLTLGVFFLWSSNAITEGTTSKISVQSFKKNSFDFAGKIVVEPLFHTNLV